jgi:uncharacterized coiled-coil DUF342 family protein
MGNIIAGTAFLLSIGFNGLALWYYKDYQRMKEENEEMHFQIQGEQAHITRLEARVRELSTKLTPWNKGKTGYKQKPRVKITQQLEQFDQYPTLSELAQGEALFTPRLD